MHLGLETLDPSIYEFVRLVSTFISANVRPVSTDFGTGCFSGGALVTSRSSES